MRKVLFVLILSLLFSCKNEEKEITFSEEPVKKLDLTEAELYDKVLGMLVGSAIGDAMGAPTEMWDRGSIKLEYGFVKDLDSMVREVSPEGTWKTNLPAGGTTDDTRWKKLTFEYLTIQNSKDLKAKDFANKILETYQISIDNYGKIKSFEPEPFEENTLKVAWLQEWAKVSKPYVAGNLDEFQTALNRFYGGEMVCAGLLYAPGIGVFFPGDPNRAYDEMYDLSIFDIGYARDISALAAAMTSAGMKKNAKKEDLLDVLRSIDPQGYFKSRLVGRTSYRILRTALAINRDAKAMDKDQMQKAFELLDQNLQDMPFHAGEIHLQVLTAMLFSDFDYIKTMQFLVNYGRDNDTTAAIAGGILGAFVGFEKLPADKEKVIEVSKNQLDTDLELLAQKLTKKIIELNS
ncbi:ADP-ribosylglycohydrolase family protein [Lacihabitans sp. LS3-19]|uniref:ADP-ribosylglycohydrolase family protein n=1 Tax=Lacihabitans sp. LS3-19 TaxID=2487335 RepID=UPI0020CD94DA|nr:ADP-ribosylglycohydrolase family protein [Lacihabitans sp. LS3-19]MCP9770181.1 ADP-ribosylglycohydrolase family protein [Lacihabitans sp. LS3-19]